MVFAGDDGRRHLASPIRFRDEPSRPSLHELDLGEHADEFVAGLDPALTRHLLGTGLFFAAV